MRPVEADELRVPSPLDSVRVTLADHTTVVLHAPRVIGDTLEGTVGRGAGAVRRRLPLSQVAAMDVRVAAPDRTVDLVFSALMAAALVLELEHPQPADTAP